MPVSDTPGENGPGMDLCDRGAFEERFDCATIPLPRNIALVGWSADTRSWSIAPMDVAEDWAFRARVPATVAFIEQRVLPRLATTVFWLPLCFADGWRERIPHASDYRWTEAGDLGGQREWRGQPGELPLLSPDRRPVGCYGAHRGDPSALLLPEAHYLARARYLYLFAEVRAAWIPWEQRRARAVYCGGDHGETANYFPPAAEGRPHPRRYLKQLVDTSTLPVDLRLGQGVSLAEQMTYRWILDVDGYTRTWDAFAWKMASGSTVLSALSPWESFFTRQFRPWEHYVPVANDFSDLDQRLDWCLANDAECRRIAERARRRANLAYHPDGVASRLTASFQFRMGGFAG